MSFPVLLVLIISIAAVLPVLGQPSFIDSSVNALPDILTNGGVYVLAINGTGLSRARISGRCTIGDSSSYNTLIATNVTSDGLMNITLPFLAASLACSGEFSFTFALFDDEISNNASPVSITARSFSLKNVTWSIDGSDECKSSCYQNITVNCRDPANNLHQDSPCALLYGTKPGPTRSCLGGVCATQSITPLFPNAGYQFVIGSVFEMNWTWTGTNFPRIAVDVYLASDEYLFALTITSNTGYYSFKLSVSSLEKYANKQVYLLFRNPDRPPYTARSGIFTLVPGPKQITSFTQSNGYLFLNGNDIYYAGQNVTVTYSSEFISSVNIYLRYEELSQLVLLAANQSTSTFANIRTFTLNIAMLRSPGSRASLYLCDATNTTLCLTSTNRPSFLIHNTYWQIGDYGVCSSSCNNTRTVVCRGNETGYLYSVADYLCVANNGPKPATFSLCRGGQCVAAFSSLSIGPDTSDALDDFTVGGSYFSTARLIGPISSVSFYLHYSDGNSNSIFLGNITVQSAQATLRFTINRLWIRDGVKASIKAFDADDSSIFYASSQSTIYDVHWTKVYSTNYCNTDCKKSATVICQRILTNATVLDYSCINSGLSKPSSVEDCVGGYCGRSIIFSSPSPVANFYSNLLPGTSYTINWTTNGNIAAVNIKVCTTIPGSDCPINIQSNYQNTGSYAWVIPNNQEPFTNRYIRIEDGTDSINIYWSSNAFNLVAKKAITISPPAANGTQWKIGNTVTVYWTAIGVSRIKIVLSPISSGTFDEIEIIASLSATDVIYSFSLSSEKYSSAVNHFAAIRLIDLDYQSVMYQSDRFIITNEMAISFSPSITPSLIRILSLACIAFLRIQLFHH